jgi:hypothetical protein
VEVWTSSQRRSPWRSSPCQTSNRVLFIGEPDDVPDRRFGVLLPNREYATRHYHFVGYAFPFDPAAYSEKEAVRAALGYDERPLVVCAVGEPPLAPTSSGSAPWPFRSAT